MIDGPSETRPDGIAISDHDESLIEEPSPTRAGYSLPRGLIIGLGLAAAVIVVAGLHAVPQIIAPIFLALVLTITVDPLRGMMIRRGAPRWLATLVVVIGVFAIIIGLVVSAIIGIARFASILPQYADEIQNQLAGLKSWLAGLGVSQADIEKMFSSIDKSSIIGLATAILTSLLGVLTSLFFIITLLIFLAVDGSVFGHRMNRHRPGREPVLTALGTFAAGTRNYFGVATIFGAIVAVLDGAALLILGIPGAGLWALLAFVTNYVPNIGFLIGLVPPALIALLDGGVSKMIIVIAVYCVLNFIIQSVLQPKFVGDAVGLTSTMSFLSLIVWGFILGPIGAILAVPASLLFKALLVDVDPDAKWLQLFLGDEPLIQKKDPDRSKRGHLPRRDGTGHPGRVRPVSPGSHATPAASPPVP